MAGIDEEDFKGKSPFLGRSHEKDPETRRGQMDVSGPNFRLGA